MKIKLDELALKIDIACDQNDAPTLHCALNEIKDINLESLKLEEQATLNFFLANIHVGLRREESNHHDFAWNKPLLESEIYHLRLALHQLADTSNASITTDLKFRITTNLANALNHVGRFIEAIELWDQAILEQPNFSMAIGNRAQAMYWYARYIDNGAEQTRFLKDSYISFRLAVSIGVEDHAHDHMQAWVKHLGSKANWDAVTFKTPKFRKGKSKIEKQYRKWCVHNRLALTPLNDLSQDWVSLRDTLSLPSISTSVLGDAALPKPYAIFNQLKQEYISARYLIFEAILEQSEPLHFADKGVVLYDALDYRYYRLWVEKLKMAILSVHTVFDKIAYLINDYLELALPIRAVDFNSIWYSNKKERIINEKFTSSNNWPLLGLFWLSKDFYYKSNANHAINPDAKTLHDIRNHIAHKYLRVHDHWLYKAEDERQRSGHDLEFPISELELKEQSIKLLKLARSALIYLSAAVLHEESKKSKDLDSGFVMPMIITSVEDKYRM